MQKYNELKDIYAILNITNTIEAEILNMKMENLTKKWNQIFFSGSDDVIKKDEAEKIKQSRPTQLDVQSFKIELSNFNNNNVFKVSSHAKNILKTPELNKLQSSFLVETSIPKTPNKRELDNFIEVSKSSKIFSKTTDAVDQTFSTNDTITIKFQPNEIRNKDIQTTSDKTLLRASDRDFNMIAESTVNSNNLEYTQEEEHVTLSNSESNLVMVDDESLFQPEQISVKLSIETLKMIANDLFDWLSWINHTLESQVRYN